MASTQKRSMKENRKDLSNAQINSIALSCYIDVSKIIKVEDLLPMEIDNIKTRTGMALLH